MHDNFSTIGFIKQAIKDIPPEQEKPYLIYKKAYITGIQDIVDSSGSIEELKINNKYAEHMLKAIENDELLNSLPEKTQKHLKSIFINGVNLAMLTNSEIAIYLSKEGEYAVIDIGNDYNVDVFCPEIFLFNKLSFYASEIMICKEPLKDDQPTISFYFDFEEDARNVANFVKSQTLKLTDSLLNADTELSQ